MQISLAYSTLALALFSIAVIAILSFIKQPQQQVSKAITYNTAMPAVQKVLVINLKRRPDRLDLFRSRYPFHFQNVQVVEAFDGKRYAEEIASDAFKRAVAEDLAVHVRNFGNVELVPGELGCFLSHRACWTLVGNMPSSSRVAVFEDDVNFSERFSSVMQDLAHDLEDPSLSFDAAQIEFIYLGGRFTDNYTLRGRFAQPSAFRHSAHQPDDNCSTAACDRTTIGYIITPAFAKKLLHAWQDSFQAVDHFMRGYMKLHKQSRHVLHVNPMIVYVPRNFSSDVQGRSNMILGRQILDEVERAKV